MFTNLIQLFKDAQQAAQTAYDAVLTAEIEAFIDRRVEYTAMNTRSKYAAERELQEFCSRLVGRLVMEASRKFAPGSGRLEIDKDEELRRFGLHVNDVLEAGRLPDLDGSWQHLEKTFGGDADREVAFTQAAKAIINGFWLKPDSEIKRTSSAVVLEKRVSSEISFHSSGKRRIHYGSTQGVAVTLDGLATFASKHQFSALGQQLRHCNVSNLEFDTREKMSFNGLDVVMFDRGFWIWKRIWFSPNRLQRSKSCLSVFAPSAAYRGRLLGSLSTSSGALHAVRGRPHRFVT